MSLDDFRNFTSSHSELLHDAHGNQHQCPLNQQVLGLHGGKFMLLLRVYLSLAAGVKSQPASKSSPQTWQHEEPSVSIIWEMFAYYWDFISSRCSNRFSLTPYPLTKGQYIIGEHNKTQTTYRPGSHMHSNPFTLLNWPCCRGIGS